MTKQLRVLVGDIGDDYSASCAAALTLTGDWAITRQQQRTALLEAVRTEHVDVLILNLSAPTMHFPDVTAEILRHTKLIIIALYHTKNKGLAQIFMQQGVHYMPFPRERGDLVKYVHELAGQMYCSSPAVIKKPEPELAVTRLLHSFAIPINLHGFNFLRCAILFSYEQGTHVGCMMSTVYPAVAEALQTTPARVERSIRHAIMQAWENSSHNVGYQFGININRRMTNSEFISFAVDWLRTECEARRQFC